MQQTRTGRHTNPHLLSGALRWQAVIPELAYERSQLEGVAVTVAVCCVLPLDGSSSVLPHPPLTGRCCTLGSASLHLLHAASRAPCLFFISYLHLPHLQLRTVHVNSNTSNDS